jgi:hypothetical protein
VSTTAPWLALAPSSGTSGDSPTAFYDHGESFRPHSRNIFDNHHDRRSGCRQQPASRSRNFDHCACASCDLDTCTDDLHFWPHAIHANHAFADTSGDDRLCWYRVGSDRPEYGWILCALRDSLAELSRFLCLRTKYLLLLVVSSESLLTDSDHQRASRGHDLLFRRECIQRQP